MNKHIFNIIHYSIGDYLLVSRLLSGDTISWEESKVKLLSSRATNHASSIRKIVRSFECIENETVPTTTSYYEVYKMNPDYKSNFQELKMLYETNKRFMKRLNKKLEKIAESKSS